jgi:hypothetical protein
MLVLVLYGFKIEIHDHTGAYKNVLDWLQDDFRDFPAGQKSNRSLEIEIGDFLQTKRPLWFFKPSVFVFGWGRKKNYLYKSGVKLSVDFASTRTVQVFGRSECVYEKLYLLILSTIGEWLEDDGWVRLHALSFMSGDKATAMVAPQGFGKSYLADRMLKPQSGFQVLGDEIAICKDGIVAGLPLRLATRDTCRQDLRLTYRDGNPHKQISEQRIKAAFSAPLNRLLLVNCTRFSVILGLGLPQMIEYRWRLDGIPGLIKMTLFRIRLIFSNRIQFVTTERLSLHTLKELLES